MMRTSPPPSKGSHDSNRLELDTIGEAIRRDEESQLLALDRTDIEERILPLHSLNAPRRRRWSVLSGPNPPKTLFIRPIFPTLQKAPVKWLASHKTNKKTLFVAVLFVWFLIFALTLRSQLPTKDGNGSYVVNLDCTDTLWRRKNECGLRGIDCRPFSDRSFAFKCPAECAGVKLLNPHIVGPSEVNYRPLIVGTGPYRGDSFLCGSAIHAGIITNRKGGCGRIKMVGKYDKFPSDSRNGIQSIAFDSHFPLAFEVTPNDGFRCSSDPRSSLLPISLFITTILAIFSTSPIMFFPIFTIIFAHVAFVSDPPGASFHNITVLPDHISMFAKRLLPAFFVAIIVYTTTIKRTLAGLTAQYEKAIFWLGGFWIGALSNYTFDWIPISRLTAHDLNQQPGAKLALAIIIMILITIVIGQAYYFWLEGRLLRYLSLYALFISSILICLTIPGVNLRIHHYILALLFLPGTSLQTRPSLLYQGILLGLFVNGVARWDFDSVLQTSDALRGDAKLDSVSPSITAPEFTSRVGAIIATFAMPALREGMDGISVLINDVEESREFYESLPEGGFVWSRPSSMDMKEYVRWAYIKDGKTLDYSKAGVLGNGTWTLADEKATRDS